MKVGVQQGSVLSPLVFAIVVDMATENVRNGFMSEMLYADDLVLISETIEGLREKFWKWKEAFESKGLKVNLRKTKVVVSGAEGEVSVSKVDPCGICGQQFISRNEYFFVVTKVIVRPLKKYPVLSSKFFQIQ